MSIKLGILGGTFNPIHYGHLAAAEEVRERLKLDKILFMPSYLPPHKQEEDIPLADQRYEMVRLATSGNPNFDTSNIELKRRGKSYTIDTIETLQSVYPNADLNFITGIDTFLEIQTWKEWERLFTLCSFVVLSRPGYRFTDLKKIAFMKQSEQELDKLDRGALKHAMVRVGALTLFLEMIELYDISSTDIRRRVREGRSIKYHLPEAVEIYIIKNRLYA